MKLRPFAHNQLHDQLARLAPWAQASSQGLLDNIVEDPVDECTLKYVASLLFALSRLRRHERIVMG